MLLQTNSYIVPKEKRAEHSRLIRRFRQTLLRLGCDHFEVYEQVGSNWSNSESAGRYVQILRFLDRKHQLAVQSAERSDPTAQAVIADFCELINFPYQQQQGLFAVGFYTSVLPVAPKRGARGELVSTVEHEVIDDPEAEKPYPGASDGPPLEEAVEGENAEPVSAEAPVEESTEPTGEEPGERFDEPNNEPIGEPAEITTESPIPVAEAVDAQPISHPAAHSDSGADFMKLVGSDLGDEDLDRDAASGFIEGEIVEDAAARPLVNGEHSVEHSAEPIEELAAPEPEPAQRRKSKKRPPGW